MINRTFIEQHRDAILEVARRHGARDVRVFGSVARYQTTEASDLDLLVRFEPGRSLMDHGMLIEDLQDLLGINVDVVSEGGMRARFLDRVLKDAVPL